MSQKNGYKHSFHQMNRIMMIAIITCAMFVSGCSSISYEVVKNPYDDLKNSAARYSQQEQFNQVYIISSALLNVNPLDSEVQSMQQQALAKNPDLERFETRWVYGSSQKMRESKEVTLSKRILLYPVALLSDIIDIFTIEVGTCLGVGAKVQVTDAAALGVQYSAGETGYGLHNGHFTKRESKENFMDLLPIESRGLLETRADKSGIYAIPYSNAGLKKPKYDVFQSARDYWAVGAQANVGIVSANLKIHPMQIWDLFAGIFFMDPLRDNPGTTTPIKLDQHDLDAIRSLLTFE